MIITYTESTNTPSLIFTNAAGCDSTISLNLTIRNSNDEIDVQNHCDSYIWINGETYTESNDTATFILQNVFGCDSVVTLNLTINSSFSTDEFDSICEGETLSWHDTLLSDFETGQYLIYDTTITQNGCDSVLVLNLTVSPSPEEQLLSGGGKYCAGSNGKEIVLENSEIAVTYQLFRNNILIATWIGDGYSHSFGPNTEVGTYTVKAVSANGCERDFEYEINIDILPQPPERIIQCD